MNFTIKEDIQEKKIVQSVFDKNNGDDETYKKYISDTEEAKNLIMTDFLQSKFKTYDDVTGWFVENYKMYDSNPLNEPDQEHTYYRAFLSLENDVVFVLRVTNHYATRDSVKKIYKKTDIPKPGLIYHIIIDRIEITYSSPQKRIVDGEKVKRVQGIENFVVNVKMDDLCKNDKSVGKQDIAKTLSSLFDKGKISPDGETIVATNEQVMSYERFQWCKRINETLDALVGVTFTDEDGTVQNTADDLGGFLEKPWEERFHYTQIDGNKYVYDSPGQKVVLKGCEEMGKVRDTQWFVHENGTIASFRRCSDRGYFFAETSVQLAPSTHVPAYEQVWTYLSIIPEWVLKHFCVLEFIGGVDIDDVA